MKKSYYCEKRGFDVYEDNYCDWFLLKRRGLRRRNCINCKYLKNDKIDKHKQKSTAKDCKSPKTERETKTTRKKGE